MTSRFALPLSVMIMATVIPDGRGHAQQPSCTATDSLTPLTVTVVDRATRVPLSGAEVRLGRSRSSAALTDSIGEAAFCVSANRTNDVRVSYFDVEDQAKVTGLPGRASGHTFALDVPTVLLRGTVLDQQAGTPMANVAVRILNTRLTTVTNGDGRFFFEQIPIGAFELRAEHLGFATVQTRLDVRHDDLDASIRMAPAAIEIAPIIVTAFSRRLDRVGFYERERRGMGTFINRRQIESMKVQSASDLLRGMAGLRLVPQVTRRNQSANQMRGRGNCMFKFIVDGARTLPDFDIDFVTPYSIEGLEVYSGLAEVPAEFRSSATPDGGTTICGVIAIWTRDSR